MNSLGFDKKPSNTKVVVAMSGGVDSSVAAAILKNQGYNVIGITLRLYNQNTSNNPKSCCAGQDIEDAISVSKKIDISHKVFDYQSSFFNNVIDNFIESYSEGETPVPCIKCNQTVKFTDLLKASRELGADALVTGHYIRRVGGLKNAKLYRAKDLKKDQSYFLFATTKDQIDYLRFPIGEYYKSEIRDLAKKYNLSVVSKPDSQDICFVSSNSYRDLIKNLKPESFKKGNIYSSEGEIIGEHNGIVNYTIGQRKGLGINGNPKPLYVINIDKKNNSVILGEKKLLKKYKVFLKEVNWIGDNFSKEKIIKCTAKLRSTQSDMPGKLKLKEKSGIFEFDNEIITTSPGQACVFYYKNQVLGGGWVSKEQ
ncbi:MAG: tRNA-specific 2-thiouridylase MnmA [Alphaproteobacteria bacterium MarineAlpha5_Bin9]|nr:MAG: tRNA-specific 2-thiouridylase MnmA [Alphaproteobacteria bacterium MarineAlpha5_Bin9]|tara:strand:+ start:3477 stop:4580 length:1104 start_codon:yes stop_codon:yes gene_type:complete